MTTDRIGPPPGNWGGIRSGRFTIFALGCERVAEVDLTAGTVLLDMGGPQLTPVPDGLLPQALDRIRAVAPPPAADDDRFAAALAANAAALACGDWDCAFTSDDDPRGIPDGYGCGGCSCHMSAPCHHCMSHLPAEDADHIAQMLDLTGRATGGNR